jgi:hypothetical protein
MQKPRTSCMMLALVVLIGIVAPSPGQETTPLFFESFDTTAVASLPAWWRSSQKKLPGTNDWGTTASTTYSPPRAVLATNATVEQWLSTPVVPCSGTTPGIIQMKVRRSGTFSASVAVEVSIDSGKTYPILAGIVHPETGNGSYQSVQFTFPPATAGVGSVCVRWRIIPDSTGTSGTYRMDDIRLTSTRAGEFQGDSLIINEIMYSPRTGEPEWIEILNIGGNPADLRGWSISDASTTTRHSITGSSMVVSPGEYIILTSDTIALAVSRTVAHTRAVQTSGFPSLNNGGDAVHLLDGTVQCRDSVTYQPLWGGGPGISLERIDPSGRSMDAGNWISSADPEGATPGRANSVMRRDCDLSPANVQHVNPGVGEACDIAVTIRNLGRSPALAWTVLIGDDGDRDSVAEANEIVARESYTGDLGGGDSLRCVLRWAAPAPGKHFIRVEVQMTQDERHSNDGLSAPLFVPIAPGSVRVNEVMYDPLPGMPEFIELTNVSAPALNLEDCTLTDLPTPGGSRNCWKLSGQSYRVEKGGYLAVVADSSGRNWFPSLGRSDSGSIALMNTSSLGLNNEGDAIVLSSAEGVVLDSICFAESFHTPDIPDTRGRSLELVNPSLEGASGSNWGTCVDPSGGTPAARNSIAVEVLPSGALLSAAPNPFSPDGDGDNDVSVLSYMLPVRSSLIRVRVFDIRGRVFRELANIVPAGATGSVVWDGRDDQGRRGRIGVYIALIEGIDAVGEVAVAAKCAVVLAGRL